jgi:hypothetical protein
LETAVANFATNVSHCMDRKLLEGALNELCLCYKIVIGFSEGRRPNLSVLRARDVPEGRPSWEPRGATARSNRGINAMRRMPDWK